MATISPDGKYVVYVDPTGVYLRQIDSGEIRPLPQPKDLSEQLVSGQYAPSGYIIQWEGETFGLESIDTWWHSADACL